MNRKGKRTLGKKVVGDFAGLVMRGELVDLGDVAGPALSGVLIPLAELGAAKVGITSQFLQEAKTYHERYSAVPYFT